MDLGAFKISYGKNAPIPTDVNEDTQKPVRIPTHTPTRAATQAHTHTRTCHHLHFKRA